MARIRNKKMEINTGGVGILTVLGIVFIVLKLTGHITWSWIWVLSPLWIGFIFWLLAMLIILAIVNYKY
jgi:hypothetical protein